MIRQYPEQHSLTSLHVASAGRHSSVGANEVEGRRLFEGNIDGSALRLSDGIIEILGNELGEELGLIDLDGEELGAALARAVGIELGWMLSVGGADGTKLG